MFARKRLRLKKLQNILFLERVGLLWRSRVFPTKSSKSNKKDFFVCKGLTVVARRRGQGGICELQSERNHQSVNYGQRFHLCDNFLKKIILRFQLECGFEFVALFAFDVE